MATQSILVVDDDRDILTNIYDILTDLGYDADTAVDGMSALELVRNKTYDLALLDYNMPDLDGTTLYVHMKQLQPELVAIMVTAHAASDGVKRARDAGTWQVLRKPVDLGRLLSLIEETLR